MKQIRRIILSIIVTILCMGMTFAMPQTLIPGGNTVGMKAYTDGLLICEIVPNSPAEKAGLRVGDVLLSADGEPIQSAEDLQSHFVDAAETTLTLKRGNTEKSVEIVPQKGTDGVKIGICLRDSIAGIGTVTYYDPEDGSFGALGHGITDADGTALIDIQNGIVVPSSVSSVVKGKSGAAGQLQGDFDTSVIVGSIADNTANGVFGTMAPPQKQAMPVASADDVQEGKAEILANVSGEDVEKYAVEIEQIYSREKNNGRNLLLRITDPKLLQKTGGIVQGMSGSPILQNGKLVGAVTHVLVNSPEMGYGILMENMLTTADKLKRTA